MNKVILTGNLCFDLELKTTPSGKTVMNNKLAVRRPHSPAVTDFIPFAVWNQPAEYLGKYAKKGSKISIVGKITTGKYQDKETGKDIPSFTVEVEEVEILDSRTSNGQANESGSENQQPAFTAQTTGQFMTINPDDDIPF